LMINEFAGRTFTCLPSAFVPNGPGYEGIAADQQVCSAVGAVAGASVVQGEDYIVSAYQYLPQHKWRNFGILWVFMIGLLSIYLVATEYITAKKSKGEVLLFRRGHAPAALTKKHAGDVEVAAGEIAGSQKTGEYDASAIIKKQTAIFSWEDVCYDIKIKGEPRRILDHVDGWVKPGTLTALMVRTASFPETLPLSMSTNLKP
jgi:ATP-binding cassette subfamily G (WHITE) protein 2 (PDR)